MSELILGHHTTLVGGREVVIILASCQHDDQWYDSRHEERGVLHIDSRAEVIKQVIKEHRENLLEKGVVCECVPGSFHVERS